MPESRLLHAADLHPGLKASFEREIGEQDVAAFAALSGDYNPLHTEEAYASQTNYGKRIVHGAFQVGLASAMAGMSLPGRNVVVGSMRSRFPAPLYFPSKVLVAGEILTWLPESTSGMLRVQITEMASSVMTAEIHVGFGLHESRERPGVAASVQHPHESDLPVVVLTGAGGAVGRDLAERLSTTYRVIGTVRSAGAEQAGEIVECDLTQDGWEERLDAALAGRGVHGLVHAAWPGAPVGSLLRSDPETVLRQLEFGGPTTIRLAAWLVRHTRGSARMVVLSSTAATLKPEMNLGSYSLGKATLEHAVRLLSPELAGKGITINAVLPSFMPLGMNSAKTKRSVLIETGKVPLGRLCTPEDIAGAVEYLLSDRAAFVTGQLFPLTGGLL